MRNNQNVDLVMSMHTDSGRINLKILSGNESNDRMTE